MKITVPTDLSEITLGQLQKLTDLENSDKESTLKKKEIIELLTGVDRATLDRFRLSDLENVYAKLLLISEGEHKLHKLVTLEGLKYGFHPNLSNISTGEFADLDTLCQDFNANLHLIMAVLYRPITLEDRGKYQIEAYTAEIDERASLFQRKLPASVVNGALIFFWNLGNDYLLNTMQSLRGEIQTRNKQTSLVDGDGTQY